MSNPLTEVVSPIWRKRAYAVAFVLSIVATCYEAADGDYRKMIVPVLTALTSALSASNVRT